MKLRTCITPTGFRVGVHDPSYDVANLRLGGRVDVMGLDDRGNVVDNHRNFPDQDIVVPRAARIYEIPNAFPFRGTTFIDSSWADVKAGNPASIRLPVPSKCSLRNWLKKVSRTPGYSEEAIWKAWIEELPEPLLLALAATSTDPEDLRILARLCCDLVIDPQTGEPTGLCFGDVSHGRMQPVIHRHDLFETLVNNAHLPDSFKRAMVLRPGVQGGSEIVGDFEDSSDQTHVFEYLRRNSYIPWGHYAANMADDAARYAIGDLSPADMRGLRHLYYQRTYVRLAKELGLAEPRRRLLDAHELERLRLAILAELEAVRARGRVLTFNGSLWGWNFGFDFAPSGYRLHASHQQVHQQYALIPATTSRQEQDQGAGTAFPAFACGDLVAEVTARYRAETGQGFFEDYLRAMRGNRRTDGRPGESSLIVHEDEQIVLFVPKAQTSGWELQLMPVEPVGNILEANIACRAALDRAMLLAQQVLEGLGARLVTSIEYSRRFDSPETDQRLLYAFLPKLPYAPGGFSEAQLRSIVGHYPEDFAAACRAEGRKQKSEDRTRKPEVGRQPTGSGRK
jgi:hypothetical protein